MIKVYAYTINDLMNFIADKTTLRAGSCSSSLDTFNLSGTDVASEWEEFEEQIPEDLEKKPEKPEKKVTKIPTSCVVDFSTHCSTSNNTWQQRIVMLDVVSIPAVEVVKVKTFDDLKKYAEVMNGNVKVGCNCPSFVFWGNAYEIDGIDSGDGSLGRYKNNPYPETRAPQRNVSLPGYLCKHLISVLSKFFG